MEVVAFVDVKMTVMLLVDGSASERFMSVGRSKRECVAEVAALLAFSAIKNNDRVGLVSFTDQVERYVPPKKGRGHVMRVVTEILNAQPQHRATSIRSALDHFASATKRRAVAFLISDFLDTDYEHALRVAGARHDLIPVQVIDPREETLPPMGLATVEDLESGEILEVDMSDPQVRSHYAQEAMQQRAARERLFRRLRLDYVTVYTDQSCVRPISELFRLRQKRLRGFRA